MNRRVKKIIAFLLASIWFSSSELLQAVQDAPEGKIKVVVVTGGIGFPANELFSLFQWHGDISCVHAPQKDHSEIFEDISKWHYDVIVLYNLTQNISEKRRQNFLKLLDRGVGVVALHHSIASFQTFPEYAAIVGGKYYLQKMVEDGVEHPRSSCTHNVHFKIHIEDSEHPITRGLSDFDVNDETMRGRTFDPKNHILLTTGHPLSDRPLAWFRTYRKARVCYIQMGHGPSIFADWNYRSLIAQAIRWAAGRPTKKPIKPGSLDELAQALERIANYKHGESRRWLIVVANNVRDSYKDAKKRKHLTERLTALLDSEATYACKQFVCKQLSVIGSADCVPALARMVSDKEELAHIARYALEHIPDPTAVAALRGALGKTKGRVLAGVINSLGEGHDRQAVHALIKLLGDKDRTVSAAAAVALGKIGGSEAVSALAEAKTKANDALLPVVVDAYLRCADDLLARGQNEKAAAIYQELYALKESSPIRIAALRGLVAARKEKALAIVIEALTGDDPQMQAFATRHVRDIPDPAATEAFAAQMPRLTSTGQTLLLKALADRGDAAARPAVVAATKSESHEVRIAALQALARLGDASTVPLLAQTAATTGVEAQTARNSLNRLRGLDVDPAILAYTKKADPKARVALIRSLVVRRFADAVPTLLKTAEDTDAQVRLESLKALRVLADGEAVPSLVELLVKTKGGAERRAAEDAVVSSCVRIADVEKRAELVLAALSDARASDRCVLLPTLGRIGGKKALETIRACLNDKDTSVQGAAVRGLARWPDASVANELLDVARNAAKEEHRISALRGYIRLAGLHSSRPAKETLKMYEEALNIASRPEEGKLALRRIADVKDIGALKLALPYLDDEALKAGAAAAVVKIADAIKDCHREEARAALKKALDVSKDERLRSEAERTLRSIGK